MSGGIMLSDLLQDDIEKTRKAYREAYGCDIGVGGLLEIALLIYRAQLLDVAERNRRKKRERLKQWDRCSGQQAAL